MKVTVKDKTEKKELPYPKLMKHITNDIVVLFREKKFGVVIFDNSCIPYETGMVFDNLNMEVFTDFHGEITLSNGNADE